MEEYNIKKTLRQCKRAATNGYKLSAKQYKNLNETMNAVSDKIEMTLVNINSSPCFVSEATDSLSEQLSQTRSLLENISSSMNEDLITLKESLSKFSITLFGKTMAGKSTLMEVLTEGDGASIGKGSQRTTRDVRSYTWNNLEITDVPGIGAFEGEEDENIAFWAARKADLILFLITDDAPQAAEAECLSRIIELGKPVVCVLNVKSSMRDGENPKMTLRNIEKAFNEERLESLKNQFMAFASLDGEVWDDIPVISVHLKSAYMSQKTNDSEYAKELSKASRIDTLKAKIIEEVETHGKYYREKNFVDIVSISTLDIFESLLFQSNLNQGLCKIIDEKRKQLKQWSNRYYRDSSSQIKALVSAISADLKMEIPSFAEEHYDDKNAANAWSQIFIEKGVDERAKELSNSLAEQADDRLKELARSIANELQYASNIFNEGNINIPKMHKIFDMKKAWNWGSLAVGGGLTITGGVLFLLGSAAAGPVGWVALGVTVVGTIGSFIFKSRGKKEDKARKELEEHLQKNVEEICESIEKQLMSVLNRIMNERIGSQTEELNRIVSLIRYLSQTQNELANRIQPNLLEQSKQILDAALRLVLGGFYGNRIVRAARVPGKLLIAQLADGKTVPDKKVDKLKTLMQEELCLIEQTEDTGKLMFAIFGEEAGKFTYANGTYHSSFASMNLKNQNRTRIAQQFLGKYFECVKE